jgi:hypothetical protein
MSRYFLTYPCAMSRGTLSHDYSNFSTRPRGGGKSLPLLHMDSLSWIGLLLEAWACRRSGPLSSQCLFLVPFIFPSLVQKYFSSSRRMAPRSKIPRGRGKSLTCMAKTGHLTSVQYGSVRSPPVRRWTAHVTFCKLSKLAFLPVF